MKKNQSDKPIKQDSGTMLSNLEGTKRENFA